VDEQTKKAVKAKLYNFKSFLDGKVQEVDAGLVDVNAVSRAVGMIAGNICSELDALTQSQSQ
jgi:hypothetical protein